MEDKVNSMVRASANMQLLASNVLENDMAEEAASTAGETTGGTFLRRNE